MIALSAISLEICSNPLQQAFRKALDKGTSTLNNETKSKARKSLTAYLGLSTACILHEVVQNRAEREETSKLQALGRTAKDIAVWTPFHVVNTAGIIATAPFWSAVRAIERHKHSK